jgi:hypothetical protein
MTIVSLFIMPLVALYAGMTLNVWSERPDWCSPLLLTSVLGLLTIQLIYFLCWDFDFLSKRKA